MSGMPLSDVFAHLHQLLVHFPIACIVVAVLIEWIALIKKRVSFGPGVPVLLTVGLAVGTAAIFSGFKLSDEVKEGFADTLLPVLERHEQLGIASMVLAFLALVAGIVYRRGPSLTKKIAYLVLIHAAGVSVALAGKAGGILQHGSDWLPWWI